jgi:phosphoglycerol transferase
MLRQRDRGRGRLLLEGTAVALLALGCAAWALQLWRADLSVPLRYAAVDDTKFYLALVKGIIGHGWFQTNSSLGAPFGQQLYDFPQGADNLNFLLIKFFALFSSSPAVVANLFFLSTFALCGLTGYLVLRQLGAARPSSLLGAVLFAVLPYHFFRGESHLLLSAYYAVPLSAYLFFSLLGNRDLFERRRAVGPRPLTWISGRSLFTLALCVVIGSDSLYYATLAEVLLVAATLVALALRRPARQVLTGAILVVAIAATMAANLAPSLVYQLRHGPNHQLTRSAVQDESHGLKLTNLVLPTPNSRIPPLADVAAHYDNAVAPSYCEACYASLGTVGTAGFLWLALCALGTLLGAAGWFGSRRLFRHAAFGVIVSLAVATIGGISSLLEFFVTPNIRGWNRISVFIAFFSLLAVALLLDRALAWLRGRRAGSALVPVAVGALLAFGVFDETSSSFVPSYAANAREYRSDDAFVKSIQARLPRGAGVFQLPYVPFPEGYPLTATSGNVPSFNSSYELARGYLHSDTLRWSYGAMKGRSGDWSAQLAAKPMALVLASAVAAGFAGVWVDPQGYPQDGGRQVVAALRALLTEAPLMSPAGDLWFFDLRGYADRLARGHDAAQLAALRQATLTPLRATCGGGGLVFFNPDPTARAATLSVSLAGSGAVRLTFPDGRSDQVSTGANPVSVSRRVQVSPGASTVRIAASGASGVQVLSATLTDDSYLPFAGDRQPAAQTPTGLIGPACPI